MRILHIIPGLAPAGAEMLVTKLALLTRARGHVVEILTFKNINSYLAGDLNDAGIKVIYNIKNKIHSLSNICFILKYLKHNEFDIIHAHLTWARLYLAFASFFINKKIILVTTEHSTTNRGRGLFCKPLNWLIYSRFNCIITVSNDVKKSLIKHVPFIEKLCYVIPNGINVAEFIKVKEEEKLSKNGIAVLCIANFRVAKDHVTLIKAFALTHNHNMELFLVGSGELEDKIKGLILELNLAERVHFLGVRKDIPHLIKKADIYVQPSLWEGFGIAVIEAMAGGLPVIVSNAPALFETVAEAGLIFPVGDIRKLAECLILLATDMSLRKRMINLGVKRAHNFDLNKTFIMYFALYKALLKKTK